MTARRDGYLFMANTSTLKGLKDGEALVAQLKQLANAFLVTRDGDLLSKESRDQLVNLGYVAQHKGFNYLTRDGIDICINLEILKEGR